MKFLILLLLLSGCATQYKPLGSGGTIDGYEETKISSNTYRIRFLGKDDNETLVYKYFLRRCAEVGQLNGFNYFEVKDGNSNAMVRGGLGVVVSNPQYQGTVIFYKEKRQGAFDIQELLHGFENKQASKL